MAKLDLLVDVRTEGANKLSSLSGNIGKAAGTAAKLAAGAGIAAVGAAAGLTVLAAEAEKSSVKLETAFKNMGKTSGKTLDQLKTQAEDLGAATTFDDEGIMEAQATLISFGAVSGEMFDRTITGAADLAAATGKDLPAATATLAKAMADPAKAAGKLAKAGVVLTEQQQEQIEKLTDAGKTQQAQEVIMAALEKRYEGVNEALSNTAAGEAAQAFEDLENVGEDLGSIFLPILATLAKGLQGFIAFIKDNMGSIQPIIAGIGAVVGQVFGAIGAVISGFVSGGSGGAFASIFRTIGDVVDFVAKNVFPFMIGMFQRLVAFIQENGPTIGSIVSQAFGAIVAVAKVVIPIIMRIAEVVFPILLTAAGVLLKALDGTFKLIGGIFEVVGTVVETMVEVITGAWEGLAKVTETIWNGITGTIKGVINGVIDAMNSVFGFMNGLSFGIGPFDLGPVHIDAATFDPFNLPTIPHLASGGIIDSPTLALIGERGPEAVVPLSRQGQVGGFTSVINVRGEEPFIRNEDDLVRTQQRIAFLAGF